MKKRGIKKTIGIFLMGFIFVLGPNAAIVTKADSIVIDEKVHDEIKGLEDKTPSGIGYDDLPQAIDDFIEERKEGCASV